MGALLEVKDLGTWFYTRQGIVKAVDDVDFQVAARRDPGDRGRSRAAARA